MQYSFKDCLSNNNHLLFFDFAIFNQQNNLVALIEYQGEQHYFPISCFGGVERLEKQQENDNIKKEYCKKANIPLYYINYNENIENELNKILINCYVFEE